MFLKLFAGNSLEEKFEPTAYPLSFSPFQNVLFFGVCFVCNELLPIAYKWAVRVNRSMEEKEIVAV